MHRCSAKQHIDRIGMPVANGSIVLTIDGRLARVNSITDKGIAWGLAGKLMDERLGPCRKLTVIERGEEPNGKHLG